MTTIKTAGRRFVHSQLMIPVIALLALVLFNLFRGLAINDFSFFTISLVVNNIGNTVLSGNIIAIINNASEVAILAIGMTLVTACSKGQDISVGSTSAVAGAVFVSILLSNPMSLGIIIFAFLAATLVAILCHSFTGTLVAVFNIQPMIASLILFTTGRSIAYWINGGATPVVPADHSALWLGQFIPGSPVHTPIYLVIICAIVIFLVLKFTNLRLYIQSVGINQTAARLNGINPVRMKLLSFMILGVCVAVASVIAVGRISRVNHDNINLGIEMDTILAVAIGGNALGGGKFSISGSILGAYIIQALTTTLLAMRVPSTDIQAYKAIVIIIIVVVASPVVKSGAVKLWGKLFGKKAAPVSNDAS